MATQPQFPVDILRLADLSMDVITRYFGLCPLFDQEDANLFVGSALDRLGGWLLVDSDRLRDGEAMLEKVPPPRLWGSGQLSVIFGLHNDPKCSLLAVIRGNRGLIAANLFLQGCSTVLTTAQSARVFHELVKLTKTTSEYPVTGLNFHKFAEATNGLREYATDQTTADMILESIQEKTVPWCQLPDSGLHDLANIGKPEELANIIYSAVEASNDASNAYVILKGTRQGNWIAAMLCWLRPKEVLVFVKDDQVYPITTMEATGTTRIHVHLGKAPNDDSWSNDGQWAIETWSATSGSPLTKVVIKLKDSTDNDFEGQHAVSLRMAKLQISHELSPSAVTAIGHLATALVIVVMDRGMLLGGEGGTTRKLDEICSAEFHKVYSNIMSFFGWRDGDLNGSRVESTTKALSEALSGACNRIAALEADARCLEAWIDKACDIYSREFPSAMLIDREARRAGSSESSVIDHALYLAGESLMFALCAKMPPSENCLYRPYDAHRFQEHAVMLRQLLQLGPRSQVSDLEAQRVTGVLLFSFWELRKRCMERLVADTAECQATDLAVAGNGYVAFSAVLNNWDRSITRIRDVTSIYLAPGPLKANKVEGTLLKLTEDLQNPTMASRELHLGDRTVSIYNGNRFSLSDKTAVNSPPVTVKHLWRVDNRARSLYLATYLDPGSDGIVKLFERHGLFLAPTSWKASINALAFAHHISESHYMPDEQISKLTEGWESSGQLGDKLQWCKVGQGLSTTSNFISKTALDEHLRFFEAGNLSSGRKVFVRHHGISLFACVKEAMEAGEPWVIIA